MKRIGIYSGTFNPVHPGHIAFALGAREACGLDEVVFLPEKYPRGKAGVMPIIEREALLRSATSLSPALRVLRLSHNRFTVARTLPLLEELFPESELTLLLGSDVAFTLPDWDNLAQLCDAMSFAIGMREAHTQDEVAAIVRCIERDFTVRHTFVKTGYGSLSSSHIRQQTA